MKTYRYLAVLLMVPAISMAQPNIEDEVGAELDSMYQQKNVAAQPQQSAVPEAKTAGASAPAVTVNVQAQPQAANTQVAGQSTTQVPSVAQTPVATQSVAQVAIQKQPVTNVESSPLTISRAETMRKSREDAEKETETRIVEKLEMSRMEDEKRRSQALFGDRFDEMNKPGEAKAPKAEVVASPVAVKAAPSADDVNAIVDARLSEKLEAKKEEKIPNRAYFQGLLGITDYPSVTNVKSNGSLGVAGGMKFNDRMLVEGSFSYSQFSVEQRDGVSICNGTNCEVYPRITDMDQYTAALALKYQILGGIFRPVVGGVVAYNYRTYQDQQFTVNNNNASSQAVDGGFVTGVDLEFTEKFALGLDYRYLINITNWNNNSGYQRSMSQTVLGGDKQIEKLSYQMFSVFGRLSF